MEKFFLYLIIFLFLTITIIPVIVIGGITKIWIYFASGICDMNEFLKEKTEDENFNKTTF